MLERRRRSTLDGYNLRVLGFTVGNTNISHVTLWTLIASPPPTATAHLFWFDSEPTVAMEDIANTVQILEDLVIG